MYWSILNSFGQSSKRIAGTSHACLIDSSFELSFAGSISLCLDQVKLNPSVSRVQTRSPWIHTLDGVFADSSSHKSMRMGSLPLSMNQPPVETCVLALGGGVVAVGGSLPGEMVPQSGFPFRYKDVRELFMWLVGCEEREGYCQLVSQVLG